MSSSSPQFTLVGSKKKRKKSKSKKQLYSDELRSSCKESKTILTVKVSPEKDMTTISTVKVSPEKDMTTSLNVKITPKKNVITTTTIVKISPEKKVEYQKSERSTAVRNSLEKSEVKINSLEKYEVKKRRRLASVVDPMVFDRSFFASDEAFFIYKEKYALMVGSATVIMNEYIDCEIECRDVVEQNRDLTKDKTVLKSKLKVAKSKLAARPNLEIFRDRIIPTWLTGKNYVEYKDKLIVSLYFDLTPTAKLIRERMNNYSQTCLLSVVDAMMLFYDALSAKISHDGKPEIISLTNEEWIELCGEVEFKDPVKIRIIQKLLAPVDIEDIDRKTVALRYHFIYVNHLDIDVALNSEEKITDFIKNVCGKNSTYGEFFYPVNKGKYTNEVYFQIFTTENNVVDEIEEKLGKRVKPGKNIFFRSQFVQRV